MTSGRVECATGARLGRDGRARTAGTRRKEVRHPLHEREAVAIGCTETPTQPPLTASCIAVLSLLPASATGDVPLQSGALIRPTDRHMRCNTAAVTSLSHRQCAFLLGVRYATPPLTTSCVVVAVACCPQPDVGFTLLLAC